MPSDNQKPRDQQPPTSPFRLALWNFSSQWFLIPQGTGIIAVILNRSNYQFNGLKTISVVVWIYTIALLAICLFLYLLRIILYPGHVAHVLRTSITEVACLSSISISFTSIIQMIILSLVDDWGSSWGIVAYILWWINAAMAVIACVGIPYVFVKLQSPGIKAVQPSILLPLIAALTSAAGGGVLTQYGKLSADLQVSVIIVSYLEVGVGLAMAMAFTNIFFARLFDQSFPSVEQIHADMILCGPFGQGSFALQALGQAVLKGSFAQYNEGVFLTREAATPIGHVSQFIALLAWGYGTFWWCFAIISIVHTLMAQPGGLRRSKFTLTAWALVFPWGVYTNAAVNFGTIMNSRAFKVWSTVLLLLLLVICIVNHIFTIKGLITGKILSLERGRVNRRYHDIRAREEV